MCSARKKTSQHVSNKFVKNVLNRPKNSGEGFVKNYENQIPFLTKKLLKI